MATNNRLELSYILKEEKKQNASVILFLTGMGYPPAKAGKYALSF